MKKNKSCMEMDGDTKIGRPPVFEDFKDKVDPMVPDLAGGPEDLSHTLSGTSAVMESKRGKM